MQPTGPFDTTSQLSIADSITLLVVRRLWLDDVRKRNNNRSKAGRQVASLLLFFSLPLPSSLRVDNVVNNES